MPRLKEAIKRQSTPSKKILPMAFPDEETLAFWKSTADNPQECANRIAKFSRALGGKAVTSANQSTRRWRDAATATRSPRSDALGRVLVMPKHPNLGSRSPSR
jgi:hypothetical protein